MLWSKTISGNRKIGIDLPYPAYGDYRNEREYLVILLEPDESRIPICKMGADGTVKKWYVSSSDPEVTAAIYKDLPDILSVEQIMNT